MKAIRIAALLILALVGLSASSVPDSEPGRWTSSVTVGNMGSTSTSVTIDFYSDIGTQYRIPECPTSMPSNPFDLAPGTSRLIYLPDCELYLPGDRKYSVVATADQPIAILTNLAGENANSRFTGAYGGIDGTSDSFQMYLPSVSKTYLGWSSNLSIQNLSPDEQSIVIDFFDGDGNPVTGNCEKEGGIIARLYIPALWGSGTLH